jgi:hypothetical protein
VKLANDLEKSSIEMTQSFSYNSLDNKELERYQSAQNLMTTEAFALIYPQFCP